MKKKKQETEMKIAKWKMPIWKVCMLWNTNDMKFWNPRLQNKSQQNWKDWNHAKYVIWQLN